MENNPAGMSVYLYYPDEYAEIIARPSGISGEIPRTKFREFYEFHGEISAYLSG
jgi:hypothetical protein